MKTIHTDERPALQQVTCLEDIPTFKVLGERNRFLNRNLHLLVMGPFISVLCLVFFVFPKSSDRVQLILGLSAMTWVCGIIFYALATKIKLA